MSEQPSMYSALPAPEGGQPGTIRLLNILPGEGQETVRCQLQVVSLSDAPPFEALSYAWGDPNPPEYIECNGQSKSVTPNLGAALRRLRMEEAERRVWIDAICVNQEDIDERSNQVLLMQDIYSQAWRVIVWLGEDNGQAQEAVDIIVKAASYCEAEVGRSVDEIDFDFFSAIQSGEPVLSVQKAVADNQRDIPPVNHMDDPDEPSPWDAVAWFYARPWFTRIWIVQEVAFAPVLMYIGNCEVKWNVVGVAARWLFMNHYARTVEVIENYKQAAAIIFEGCLAGVPFPFLLGNLDSHATDPRDKVFALLGLADEESRSNPLLVPDYRKDVVQVYMDATRHIIRENLGGYRLGEIFGISPEPFVDVKGQFPSWVPRWDVPVEKNRVRLIKLGEDPWMAGGDGEHMVDESTDSRILRMKGVKIGEIGSVNHILESVDFMARVACLWNKVSRDLTQYPGPDSLDQAFARTITAGNLLEVDGQRRLLGSADLQNYMSCMDEKEDLLPFHPFGDSHDPKTRAFDFNGCALNKTFFITGEGHIGLGCKIIKPGDIVCIFYGHNLPYVLRPIGDGFLYMGQCYTHGFMAGEAIDKVKAGSLADDWFELH